MAASGSCTIGGVEYQWTSPTLADLEQFERDIGPLTDLKLVNSLKARVYLAHLCLREKQPKLTLEQIRQWPAEAYSDMWAMIVRAIPLWSVVSDGEEASPRKSSRRAPSSSVGDPPARDVSE